MKTHRYNLLLAALIAAVTGWMAVRAADNPLTPPSVNELRTNSVNRMVLSPQVMRRILGTYAAQNPAEPDYHEKLAAAMDRNRELLSGILARQQQQLTQMKAQDPTPAVQPEAVEAPEPASNPAPAGAAQPAVETPPAVPPAETNAPAAVVPAAGQVAVEEPLILEDSEHRLLIELRSAAPIILKIHTNAPPGLQKH